MRDVVFFLLRLTGLPLLLREVIQRRRVSILCYHDPAPEDFARHLRLLTRIYNVISLERYLAWRRDSAVALPPKPLVITLDDGHRGNYALAGVLAQYRIPVTIFLCSAIVGTRRRFWWKDLSGADREQLKRMSDAERLQALARNGFDETEEYPERHALSADEIQALRAHADFQSHTRFHPILPSCDDARAADEIGVSKAELEQRFGLDVNALAYPNGDYTARDAMLARQAEYTCALTIDGGYNDRATDVYRLHRFRMSDAATNSEVVVKASGLWSFWERGAAMLVRRRRNGKLPGRRTHAAVH
ncbi:MAG: polysaccharide deacetylase family protein [Sulfurifustis sp.]